MTVAASPLITITFRDTLQQVEDFERHWYHVPFPGDLIYLGLKNGEICAGQVTQIEWRDDGVVLDYVAKWVHKEST